MIALLGTAGAAFAAPALASASNAGPDATTRAEQAVFEAVVRETCGRQIVLLGENGYHGEGRTTAFKARLVERLVSRCGFRLVLFEASQVEFLDIARRERRGEAIDRARLAAAVGRIWNQNREMAGLLTFLAEEKRRRPLIVGGLDDQLGSRGLLYGNDAVVDELAGYVSGPARADCHERLRRRIYAAYPESAPYSLEQRAALQRCVQAIRGGIAGRRPDSSRPFLLAMTDNIDRYLARDFEPDAVRNTLRDASMYRNFLWWLSFRGRRDQKVLVWAANSHVAEGKGVDPQFGGGAPMGHLIAARFGSASYAVGFSANTGLYRWSASESRPIPFAAASLENRAITASGAAAALVTRPAFLREPELAGLFNHQFYRAQWSQFFDAVVVFGSERPPERIDS
ncbi:MAG: erythromycin esterase family protein [Novosphingobium sp.]